MAQIRSKQIADFLASVNWSAVSANDIANAADIKSYVDGEISSEHSFNVKEHGELVDSVDSLEVKAGSDFISIDTRVSDVEDALAAEIAATNSDVSALETANGSQDTRMTGDLR